MSHLGGKEEPEILLKKYPYPSIKLYCVSPIVTICHELT